MSQKDEMYKIAIVMVPRGGARASEAHRKVCGTDSSRESHANMVFNMVTILTTTVCLLVCHSLDFSPLDTARARPLLLLEGRQLWARPLTEAIVRQPEEKVCPQTHPTRRGGHKRILRNQRRLFAKELVSPIVSCYIYMCLMHNHQFYSITPSSPDISDKFLNGNKIEWVFSIDQELQADNG